MSYFCEISCTLPVLCGEIKSFLDQLQTYYYLEMLSVNYMVVDLPNYTTSSISLLEYYLAIGALVLVVLGLAGFLVALLSMRSTAIVLSVRSTTIVKPLPPKIEDILPIGTGIVGIGVGVVGGLVLIDTVNKLRKKYKKSDDDELLHVLLTVVPVLIGGHVHMAVFDFKDLTGQNLYKLYGYNYTLTKGDFVVNNMWAAILIDPAPHMKLLEYKLFVINQAWLYGTNGSDGIFGYDFQSPNRVNWLLMIDNENLVLEKEDNIFGVKPIYPTVQNFLTLQLTCHYAIMRTPRTPTNLRQF